MIRQAFTLLASVFVTASSMAGATRAFEYPALTPSLRTSMVYVEIPPPPLIYPVAAREGELPCPPENRVVWPAAPADRDWRKRAPAPAGASWSPVYCVRIRDSGRAESVRLTAGSGHGAADRHFARQLQRMRFTPAGWHDPTTAWHRVVVRLQDLPEGYDGTPHHGPELDVLFVG